ncbi:MAG: TerB family tellurite resistance protein [Polyangiaceae bacterium]|jgi:tellurite resistance protein|nr:TerB family tellurite resistance protein [Polyangiaceae bacterium]
MPIRKDFLSQVARRVAMPSQDAPAGVTSSILTAAAGSYGFRPGGDDVTIPTGFDPHAASLFESIVEAAVLVARSDGPLDEQKEKAFRTVVLEACRGSVRPDALDALLADLSNQLQKDGLDTRIQMVARTIKRADHQREVLRIAAFLAFTSGGVSDDERAVITKLATAFGLPQGTVDRVLAEVRQAVDAG